MRLAILAFLLGVSALQMQARLPRAGEMLLLALCLIVASSLAFWASKRGKAFWQAFAIILGGFVAGLMWSASLAQWRLEKHLPAALEGQDISVIGTISNLPTSFEQGVRFQLTVEQFVQFDGHALASSEQARWQSLLGAKLALGWYRQADQTNPPQLRPGERWRLRVRLQKPHGNANPYGFDYESWLLEQDARATGYVRVTDNDPPAAQRLASFVPSFWHLVERGRDHLRQRIVQALAGKPYAGVIVALVIGDQRAVGQSDWQIFNNTGIGHLMSISGLHITMVAALFGQFFALLWRRSFFTRAQLPLLLPVQKASAVAALFAAIVYVLLAGCGVPAQRTLYMLAVVAWSTWLGRSAQTSDVLLLALGVVLVLDPWAILWPGFWLSFAAVGLILYASIGRAQFVDGVQLDEIAPTSLWRQRWQSLCCGVREAARTQAVVTLGLLPLSLLLFGQISVLGPVANAVAIPLVGLIITPLALIGAVLPAPLMSWILHLAHSLIEVLLAFLKFLMQAPIVNWLAPQPAWWQFSLAMIALIAVFAPRGWPGRYLALFGCLPMLLQQPSHPRNGELWLTAFDVGQGTAVLLETAQHRLLYDTGPSYSLQSDGGQRVILPYLKARGIASLDEVVLTHSDLDHIGGAQSVLAHLQVKQLRAALLDEHPLWQTAQAKQIPRLRCIAGQAWQWEGVSFQVLHPQLESYIDAKLKPNSRSCTLRIQVGKHRILLGADIEAREEKQLVAKNPEQLRADILLVPHHGSGTSSTLPFLFAVRPQLALFQLGYRNRYHHPKSEVWQRYGNLGVQRLRTDQGGALMLRISEEIEVESYRERHARYWYRQ